MKVSQPIIFIIALIICTSETFSQGCPACSNPALQSSEKLEAGLDTLKKGNFRATLNVTNGFDYQGGHPHDKGIAQNGQEIIVPLHEHVVELDFGRTELSLEYTFKTNWTVWLRVPFDIKMQKASITYVETVTQYEQSAILRNRDIHHRTENYMGLSDFRLLFAHRINGLFSKKGRLDFAFGTSLPIGKIEENPLKLGEEAQKHLHIQFGTGTFDPLLELHYAMGLTDKFSLALFTINKVSLYQNSKKYQGPFETTTGFSFGYRKTNWLTSRLTFANFTSTWAKWDGKNDPNSGLMSYSLTANLTFNLKNGLAITPGYRHPVAQQTLSDKGDTFKYGPTFLLNISHKFND